jgi:hypothetical protein
LEPRGCLEQGLLGTRSSAIPAHRWFWMRRSEEEAKQKPAWAADKKAITVSARKVEANRKNALKSTGPKTLRGKAYSGRNAIKHGLFTRQLADFAAHAEDSWEYDELLAGLRAQHQPIGTAEELEVERLARCWWRLKRAWRYENAMNRVALRSHGRRELAEQAEWCKELDKEDETAVLQLQSAANEIEETGEVPEGMKQRIFAIDPEFESMWTSSERAVEQVMADPKISKESRELGSKELSWVRLSSMVHIRVDAIEQRGRMRSSAVREIAIAPHVIPNAVALDKILRYETTIERQLGRTVDRLERLQRRRQGEITPPPVSIRLTRG